MQAPAGSLDVRGPFGQDQQYGPGGRVASGFIHDFPSSRAVSEGVVHSLPTIGAYSGTGSAGLPRRGRREALRLAGRTSTWRLVRGPLPSPAGATSRRQRETPEGTAESVASDPVQAPGRRFRSRGPFRQDLRYGRT